MDESSNSLIVSILAVTVPVIAALSLHIEAVILLRRLANRESFSARPRLYFSLFLFLLVHIAEILIFTVAFRVIDRFGIGGFTGMPDPPAFNDYLYYTVIAYTTIGFGDILPIGFSRLLTAVCALTGLILIAVSATYLVLHMNRFFSHRHGFND